MNRLKKFLSERPSVQARIHRRLETAILRRESTETLRALLKRTKDINSNLPDTNTTPLQLAIMHKNVSAMSALLLEGADVEKKGNSELTPLLSACLHGFLTGAWTLIVHGANISARSYYGLTCLMLAAKNESLSIVSYLLTRETCPINEVDENGFNALHYILFLNNASTTSKLLSKGADVNSQDQWGQNAVYLASNNKCLSSLRVLLEAGGDPNIDTNYGSCAFWTAMDHRCNDAVRMLLEHGADALRLKPDGKTAIKVAIERKDLNLMTILLSQEYMIEHKCVKGWTPLMTACSSGFSGGVRLLIEHGANLHAQTQDRETSVYFAVKNNHKECLNVLLEAGANPNIITTSGAFALIEAVNQGNLEIVHTLLRYGADKTKIRKNFLISVDKSLLQKDTWRDIIYTLLCENHATESVAKSTVNDELNYKEQMAVMAAAKDCIYCPITIEVMQDPVIAADGHTYERRAIEQWLRQKKESPVTRQPISSTVLTRNLAIKHIVNQITLTNKAL